MVDGFTFETPTFDMNIHVKEGASDQAHLILGQIAPEVLQSFAAKNADYGDTSFDLGIAGQYAELWRKVGKLKGPMWEGKGLQFEQVDEILSDLIGHALLTLYFLHEEEAKKATPVAADSLKENRRLAQKRSDWRKASEAAIGIEGPQEPLHKGMPSTASGIKIPRNIKQIKGLTGFEPDEDGNIPYSQKMFNPQRSTATINGEFLKDRDDDHHIPAIGCFNSHCTIANHYYAKDM